MLNRNRIHVMWLAILTFLIVGFSAQTNEPVLNASLDGVLERIKAYEALFDTLLFRFTLPDLHQVGDKKKKERRVELIYDGARHRRCDTVEYEDGSHDFKTAVTDGETYASWQRTDSNPTGEGYICPLSDMMKATFVAYRFRTHATRHLFESRKIEVLEKSDRSVTIKYAYSPRGYTVGAYESSGDYLRPLEIVAYHLDADTDDLKETTRFEYGYRPGTLWPIQMRQIQKAHDSYVTCEIQEIDLNPKITDDLFEIDFPDGAWVRNETEGMIRRIRKDAPRSSTDPVGTSHETGS